METGIVKWFSPKKGYGFIIRDEIEDESKREIFVHYSALDMPGFKTLLPGLKVEFEVELGRRDNSVEVKKVHIMNQVPVPNFKKEENSEN